MFVHFLLTFTCVLGGSDYLGHGFVHSFANSICKLLTSCLFFLASRGYPVLIVHNCIAIVVALGRLCIGKYQILQCLVKTAVFGLSIGKQRAQGELSLVFGLGEVLVHNELQTCACLQKQSKHES